MRHLKRILGGMAGKDLGLYGNPEPKDFRLPCSLYHGGEISLLRFDRRNDNGRSGIYVIHGMGFHDIDSAWIGAFFCFVIIIFKYLNKFYNNYRLRYS